jgi:hypothetical protein
MALSHSNRTLEPSVFSCATVIESVEGLRIFACASRKSRLQVCVREFVMHKLQGDFF